MPRINIYGSAFFGVLVLMVIPLQLFSQLSELPASVLSPNAASLGTYGNLPVSFYTGTPIINIPLYEMDCFGHKLPLSLNYNATGVRPDQRAGWLGVGWSLNAGGVITREVKDRIDEDQSSIRTGYYYAHDLLNTGAWNTLDYLREIAQGGSNKTKSSYKDTEPDEFSFHFPGYSGKFYLDHQGNWQVRCNKPVKVHFNNTFLEVPFSTKGTALEAAGYSYPSSFSGFTITTEEGIQYIFGGDTTAIDYSMDFFGQYNDIWTATAWYLTTIRLQNGEKISLNYVRGDFINQMYIAQQFHLGFATVSKGGSLSLNVNCSDNSYDTRVEAGHEGKLIAPVYLQSIKSISGTLVFVRDLTKELNYKTKIYDVKFNNYNKSAIYNQIGSHGFLPLLKSGNVDYLYPKCLENMKWYKLVNIMIYNSQGGFIKTFNFEYDDKPTERLMLLGISESKPNSLQEKKHRFYYNEPNSLPDYLSNKTDHWGFFNNTYAAYSQSSGDNYYNLRNPNAAYLKYGILNKIVYPTGGYTEFDFEPHYYKKQVMLTRDSYRDLNSNNLAGGLRIRGMADYTSENVKVEEKKYFYVSDYLQHKDQANQSSGVLGGQIQYSFDYIVHAFNDGYNTKTKLSVFSSVSVLPACYNTQGNHIGYSEVIEKRRDNAFTRYLYTNFDNGYLDEPAQTIIQETRTPYEPYSSKEQDRGLLQLKEEYNADGKKIRSTANSYEISNNDPSYVRSMRAKFANVCPNTAQSYDEGAAYKIYTYERRPKSVKTILYDLDGLHPISTNVNYEYTANSDGLLRSEEHNRDGGLHTNSKIEYRYAADVGHTTMVQQNMIGIPIETITYRDGRAMNVMLQPYRNENGKLFPDFQQRLEVDTPIDNYIKYTVTAGMDSRLQRQLTFDVYDSHGNILQYTRRDGVPVSYIWSYKGQYPIAEIKGATYEQVKTLLGVIYVTDFDNSLYPDVVELGSRLRTAFQDQPVFVHTFTHKPSVGIASQTDPNGITTFYEYDDLGRLHIVRDHEGNVLKEKEYHYFNE